ncbi:hypothetical protein V7S43_006544 [Phytophthora oleae]|uniref:Uncharacterized protein n=1 Tax=Phytophthora oleae TaxID=2107226 RepID=A0ABD3FQ61_9STRA
MGKEEASKRAKRARRQLEEAFEQVLGSTASDTSVMTRSAKGSLKQVSLNRMWGPSHTQLRAYIARRLINDGLPYNTVASEAFRGLMEIATGKSGVSVLSQHTYLQPRSCGSVRC